MCLFLFFIYSLTQEHKNANQLVNYICSTFHLDTILTNTKFSWFRIKATIVVTDNTAVAPFLRLVCTEDCQGGTITPLHRTWLPLLTPTALHSWLPFPLVAQGLCSCGFNGECDGISWDNIILAHWLICNFRRLSWEKNVQ